MFIAFWYHWTCVYDPAMKKMTKLVECDSSPEHLYINSQKVMKNGTQLNFRH